MLHVKHAPLLEIKHQTPRNRTKVKVVAGPGDLRSSSSVLSESEKTALVNFKGWWWRVDGGVVPSKAFRGRTWKLPPPDTGFN